MSCPFLTAVSTIAWRKSSQQFACAGVTFHPAGDVLSFPFRATHIASFGPDASGQLELWSELRSDAGPNPIGRVGQIQPDYRIKFPGATGPGSGRDLLVVECKQYRRSKASNFSAALADYARGSEALIVALVNYGPVGDAVMKRIPKDVTDRCRAIGQTRPGGDGLIAFAALLDAVKLGVFGTAQPEAWIKRSITVELRWERAVDLDLYVATLEATCGYSSPQALSEVRFVADDRGTGMLPAGEKLHLTPSSAERFDVVVVAFAGVDQVRDADAHVVIRWHDQRGEKYVEMIKLDEANAPAWHVASLMRGEPRPVIANRPADGFQSGVGWKPPG
jgi:hypothetical protein